MRLLVTGASGFVGAALTRVALDAGHEVTALVRPGGDRSRLAGLATRATLLEGDLLDPALLGRLPAGLDACVHAGWYAAPGRYADAYDNVELVGASVRLGVALARGGCRRFVGVGTCAEYDTDLGYLGEATPTRPRSVYAAAKLATGQMLATLKQLGPMEVAWARLFYLYGPGEAPGRLVSSLCRGLVRGESVDVSPGRQVRDFSHVEDVASALLAIAASPVTGAVNVGSGEPVTVAEVARTLGELACAPELVRLGARPYGIDEPMFVCARTTRLRDEVGWSPRYGLRGGLAHTLAWWRGAVAREAREG